VGMTRDELLANPEKYELRAFDLMKREWLTRPAKSCRSSENIGSMSFGCAGNAISGCITLEFAARIATVDLR
jgi:hypothetical protein